MARGPSAPRREKRVCCSPTLSVPQLDLDTLIPDTAKPTGVHHWKDVVNEEQCVAVLGSGCITLTTQQGHTMVLDTGRVGNDPVVWAVAFHPDGIHLSSGSSDGIRRWRLADGQEVGKQTGMNVRAICVSSDHKWVVCGTLEGASVWDEKIQEKATEVERGDNFVSSVDTSPDATRLATGCDITASIWNIVTGKRLVGPLKHSNNVAGVKFSPNGDHLATACHNSIYMHVFDTRNGDQLIAIKADLDIQINPVTPLEWSNNGQRIFAASHKNKIKALEVSTGSLLAESQVHSSHNGDDSDFRRCITLAANGKFLATFAPHAISFWDASTLAWIGPVIEENEKLRSITLSADCSHVATGRYDGKIIVHNLSNILPGSYGPFQAHSREEPDLETREDEPQQQRDGQPSTLGADSKRPDSTPEQPTPASRNEVSNDDLLEVEPPSSTPAPVFDYDESLSSPSSAHPHESEVPPPGPSDAISDPPPTTPTPWEAPCPTKPFDSPDSSKRISVLERWLQTRFKKTNKNQASQPPAQLPTISSRSADFQSNFQPQPTVNAPNEGPSRVAAGQRVRRAVARPVKQKPPKEPKADTKAAKANNSNKGASRSGQGHTGAKKASPTQQVNVTSAESSAGRVHVTREPGDGTVWIAFKLPACIPCVGTATEDGTHGSR